MLEVSVAVRTGAGSEIVSVTDRPDCRSIARGAARVGVLEPLPLELAPGSGPGEAGVGATASTTCGADVEAAKLPSPR